MRRQLALLSFAVGALGRRPLRTTSMAAGLVFLVCLYASALFLADALKHEHAAAFEDTPDLTVQKMLGGRPSLIDTTSIDAIRALPAVGEVSPRVWGYVYLPAMPGNVTVIGMTRAAEAGAMGRVFLRGRAPSAAATDEVAIGAALAETLGYELGNSIVLPRPGGTVTFRLVGIFSSELALQSADVVLASDAAARALLGVPEGRAVDLALTLINPDEATVLAGKILELEPSARVLDKRSLARTYELALGVRSGMLALLLLPALAALLLLAWDRLTGVGELERREIGVLKAVGWQTQDVLTARLYETAIVAVGASAAGLGLAYVYVFYAGAPGLVDALLGFGSLYPRFTFTPAVDAAQLFVILATVTAPLVALAILPAWRAATLDPDAAMRGSDE